jgi:hypothetical protein
VKTKKLQKQAKQRFCTIDFDPMLFIPSECCNLTSGPFSVWLGATQLLDADVFTATEWPNPRFQLTDAHLSHWLPSACVAMAAAAPEMAGLDSMLETAAKLLPGTPAVCHTLGLDDANTQVREMQK